MSDLEFLKDIDLFDDTPDSLVCARTDCISEAIRENDKATFLRYLRKRKKNTYPLPADDNGWTALHVAASLPHGKDYLKLLFKYQDDKLMDIKVEGGAALLIACRNACEENVKILLQNGCDPRTFTDQGFTPLLVAICTGNLNIVGSLLNYPQILNVEAKNGFEPLLVSATYGHLEICRILLENGADIRSKGADNSIALHVACRNNRFDIARLLLAQDPKTINWQSDVGITPLMIAVEKCDIEIVNFLLENGASADICDKKGRMALHCAASRGDVDLLQLILHYTVSSSVDLCLSRTPEVLKTIRAFVSITCCAIASRSVKCLEILLSSKISKSIFKTPLIIKEDHQVKILSPLACLFLLINEDDKLLNSYLQLLLNHKITTLNEFFTPLFKGSYDCVFLHPFSSIIERPLSEQQHYFSLLNANGVTLDYNLQCYYDTSEPFDTFFDYEVYYGPVSNVLSSNLEQPVDIKLEMLKLLMSNSVILEPDTVCEEFNPCCDDPTYRPEVLKELEECRVLFQYLISLKPVYFTNYELRIYPSQMPRFPFVTMEEEFSKSTLQQLCRTVIRGQLREPTLEDNLRNFRRKIMELPLPTSMKDYLLFKE